MIRWLGLVPAVLLCVLGVVGGVVSWVWAWPQFRDTLATFVGQNGRLDGLLIVSLGLGQALVVILVRVALLALDRTSQDLRVIMALAPLSRVERAVVQLAPDLLVTTAIAGSVGSLGVVSYVTATQRIGVPLALGWTLALIVIVGAVSTALETAFSKLGARGAASRSGSALVMMVLICGALLALELSINRSGLNSPVADAGLVFLALPEPLSVVMLLTLIGLGLVAWLLSLSLLVDDSLASSGRRVRFSGMRGDLLETGALLWVRNPANRIGLVGGVCIAAMGMWIQVQTSLPLGYQLASWTVVYLIVVTSVTCYGDYLAIRWRVLVGPSRPLPSLWQFTVGRLMASASSGLIVIGLVLFAFVLGFRLEWALSDFVNITTLCVLFIGSDSSCMEARVSRDTDSKKVSYSRVLIL